MLLAFACLSLGACSGGAGLPTAATRAGEGAASVGLTNNYTSDPEPDTPTSTDPVLPEGPELTGF